MQKALKFILILLLSFCNHSNLMADNIINIYNWADYISQSSIEKFENNTKIKVIYDVFDNNQMLEARLIAGKTGYDIVVPSAEPFLSHYIKNGLFQKLDKSRLPNYKNLDHKILKILEKHDPGNEYTIPWMWNNIGIGYNEKMVSKILPNVSMDSLEVLFNQEYISKLAKCGVDFLDSPTEVIPLVFVYLGIDPASEDKADLAKAEQLLKSIRPYIRDFNSSRYVSDLANGNICVVLGHSGDIIQAKNALDKASSKVEINYHIPKEAMEISIDVFAITKDASNTDEAYEFLNFILDPQVAAETTNAIYQPNANKASLEFVEQKIKEDHNIYPTNETFIRAFDLKSTNLQYNRLRNRAWMRIVTGKE